MEEIVFAFYSTAEAIQGEKTLLRGGVQPKVMPIPSAIWEGCGIGLRVEKDQGTAAKRLLRGARFQMYLRYAADGKSTYTFYEGERT